MMCSEQHLDYLSFIIKRGFKFIKLLHLVETKFIENVLKNLIINLHKTIRERHN